MPSPPTKTNKYFLFAVVACIGLFVAYRHIAQAASLTSLSDTMTRLKVSTASSHDITFTIGGSNTFAAGETITVDFHEDDSDFTVAGASSAAADFDFNDGTERTIYNVGSSTNCTGSSGANDISVGIDDTTGIVTFLACGSFTASGSGATVNIQYGSAASGGTNRVTNPSSNGTYVIDIAGTFGDSGSLAVAIASDEQLVITASVDPTITFSLSANSTAFGTLSSSSVTTASPNITLTVSTNAESGYSITVQDAGSGSNPGLYNSSAASLIGSADYSYTNTTDLSSVAGYGIQASSASATIDTRYDQTGTTVGGFEITPQTLATYGSPASSHTVTITSKAKVTGSTAAGSYTDTVTFIATGNF